jgi:predicted metal-binding protein
MSNAWVAWYGFSMIKRLVICKTCDGPGLALADALHGQAPGWDVVLHECLSACAEPVSMAVQATGKATYVFAGLTDADSDDALAFIRLYDDTPDGWVADARSAGRLRFCLKTRVPAL